MVAAAVFESYDHCNAGAMLYQLSYEATQLGAGQFVGLICSNEDLESNKLTSSQLCGLIAQLVEQFALVSQKPGVRIL